MVSSSFQVKRALLSVSDKTGLVAFAKVLQQQGIDLISTGGTAQTLRQAGVSVTEVSDITDFPEILQGRVKTLHPKIHAGILARRPEDQSTLDALSIKAIDLVVVNLYPFEQTIAQVHCSEHDAIESIDVGGPAMIRASAKNFHHVAIVTCPSDYTQVQTQLLEHHNVIPLTTRKNLAAKAFALCSRYDQAIQTYLTPEADTKHMTELQQLTLKRVDVLRYGENPHQQAALYQPLNQTMTGLLASHQLQGKPLSYNNYQDAQAAWQLVLQWTQPACVIVKHANPCGVGLSEQINQAYQAAFSADPLSAFGGILAFNKTIDQETADCILNNQFAEVILAPEVTLEAAARFAQKPNLRVLTLALTQPEQQSVVWQSLGQGFLCQTEDTLEDCEEHWQVVTQAQPSAQQWQDLRFAWRVVKHVKSNAVVFASKQTTKAIGAGQTSRVFAVDIAVLKAEQTQTDLSKTALASDAFFPFADSLEQAVKAGACCIIQPGGSMRDAEVIEAANALGIPMVFTHRRHFKH